MLTMPQAMSKCERPSRVSTSRPLAPYILKDRARKWRLKKFFRCPRKMEKANSVPVQTETARVPPEEDWEKEIEEFSRRMEEVKEKELSNETPYDAQEELMEALCEMSLYSVPHAPRLHHQLYEPSTHHTPPVKWIRYVSCIEKDQFADAEE